MKFIHCADLHLGSALSLNFDKAKAGKRKDELLNGFSELVDLADRGGYDGLLIAGDVFDSAKVSAKTRSFFEKHITAHPTLRFFCLMGNHDGAVELFPNGKPDNCFLCADKVVCEKLGNVNIVMLPSPDAPLPALDPNDYNIVIMHGTVGEGAGCVKLSALSGRGIDYLALGHYHDFRLETLDRRGKWCYSGCLEGRGFDECGVKGFVSIDADRREYEFVPFAKRTLFELHLNLDGKCDAAAQLDAVRELIRDIDPKDGVRLILEGSHDEDDEIYADHIAALLEGRCYVSKVKDETKLTIDPSKYVNDPSLKGEFVRLVMKSELVTERRDAVLMLGLAALRGEEL